MPSSESRSPSGIHSVANLGSQTAARPITGEEFDRMIEATPRVVGKNEAPSWRFALRVLWYAGFGWVI